MKMTNGDMIKNYNGLDYIQSLEGVHYRRTGEKLFKGRVKVTYAIKKNMGEILAKLKPYNESRDEVYAEYRDLDAEKAAVEKLKKKIVKSPEGTGQYAKELKEFEKKSGEMPVIMKDGKDQKEYEAKIQDLLNIEVEDVSIHMINMDILEGVELDSEELGLLMFMIAE